MRRDAKKLVEVPLADEKAGTERVVPLNVNKEESVSSPLVVVNGTRVAVRYEL